MSRMNWEKAAKRDIVRDRGGDRIEPPKRKKRKRPPRKKYQPIQGVDFTTYRKPGSTSEP